MAKEKINKGRRRFIFTVLGGSGLAIGLYLGFGGERSHTLEESWAGDPHDWKPNAWLRVEPDGAVTVRVNHSEMGQGVTTGLPTILADELEADWAKVRFEIAPVEEIYKNPAMGVQMTGGSTSTPTSWDILRQAGAVAREMLISAAAQSWQVPRAQCRARQGRVIHVPSKRTLSYGNLASEAARIEPPKTVALKNPKDFRLIGKSPRRLDGREKVEGRAVYGIDVNLPGMLTATMIHPPVLGDRVAQIDATTARSMPGVKQVAAIETGVFVAAETFWQAVSAAEAVNVTWADGGRRGLSSDKLWARWEELSQSKEAKELEKKGEFLPAFESAARTVAAAYQVPFQAHATPEPMNCTVHLEKDRARVWVPTQSQDGAQEAVARLTGLAYDNIEIITTFLGGGFGRRGAADYVFEAVRIAQQLDRPVKMIWTREEDIKNDRYRPASYNRMEAALDDQGRPTAWRMRIVGPDAHAQEIPALLSSVVPYWVPRGLRDAAHWAGTKLMPGIMAGSGVKTGAVPFPYAIDNLLIEYVADDPGIPVGFWRSVGSSSTAFVIECFIDELAQAAGRDPVAFRLDLLQHLPRSQAVLKLAAEKAGWGTPPSEGIFRGAAVHEFHGTVVAMIADASIEDSGQIKIPRVVAAVDCGIVINPEIVKAQVSGGLIFGLTAALLGEVTFKNGQVEQSNFDDFPILTMDASPAIEVHLIDSQEPPSGVGEVGVPPIAPAVANAVSVAAGKRIRRLPIRLQQ